VLAPSVARGGEGSCPAELGGAMSRRRQQDGYHLQRAAFDRTARPIDLAHLARQTLGDRSLEGEVLRMFDTQLGVYFSRVRASRDADELAMGLHTLRGASAGIGATLLADLARDAQAELAETGTIDEETLDDMAMAVAETSAYIARLLEE